MPAMPVPIVPPGAAQPAKYSKTPQRPLLTALPAKRAVAADTLRGRKVSPAFRPYANRLQGEREERHRAGTGFRGLLHGRLYGKNSFDWTVEKKNYLDRVGLWLLSADSKMQVQNEGKWRPAMAAGVQGIFMFRDAPQPPINGTFNLTVKATGKKTDTYANAYLVLTKRPHPKVILNVGYSYRALPKVIYSLSEFLSKGAINREKTAGSAECRSRRDAGGMMWPKKDSLSASR